MTPLYKYNTPYSPQSRDEYQRHDAFSAWTAQKGYESATRMRLPLVLASSRLRLGSRRCDELQGTIDELKDRLLNASPLMPFEHKSDLEKRITHAESALHTERLTVWRDLLPLSKEIRDASLEHIRQGFLSELTRLIGESVEDERTP